eukprot:CAMPEP_0197827494 /NCGR_PEP_ID=MMETSP1437-20131217/4251_1 /TAXON_ID=49252 ORGANISM="Eucampia antarctica, Strain CCMP1452" /NCGR_SAMPLE_ID=MMETSP1437 /ASSEMBLY_ACC=CAM_ASM_001096 /LENGTH=267 /DNA_ID=CAMNT_0043428343 /DNA_START=151 /DNA_END=954 /DNA_ORIENTATION=+
MTTIRHRAKATTMESQPKHNSFRRKEYSNNVFGRRRIHTSSASTVNISSGRRSYFLNDDNADASVVQNIKRKKPSKKVVEEDIVDKNGYEQMSFQEMRAELGPFGSLIANSVEVGIVTAGSFLSGGVFGYFIGGAMSVPTLFKPSPTVNNNLMNAIRNKLANANSSALTQGKSWGQLSAAFSGFQALAKMCRGNKDDKWNGILGSACAGAYLNRQGGPQGMIQSGASYAGFTYMIDAFFGGDKSGNKDVERDFDFTDTPVEVEKRGF